jgi:hypothetical protein
VIDFASFRIVASARPDTHHEAKRHQGSHCGPGDEERLDE